MSSPTRQEEKQWLLSHIIVQLDQGRIGRTPAEKCYYFIPAEFDKDLDEGFDWTHLTPIRHCAVGSILPPHDLQTLCESGDNGTLIDDILRTNVHVTILNLLPFTQDELIELQNIHDATTEPSVVRAKLLSLYESM